MANFITLSTSLICGLFIATLGSAQSWPKIYNFYPGTRGDDVKQAYDKSFIITGNITNGSLGIMGIIIKTDVNGNTLWYRKVGNTSYRTGLNYSYLTQDNGIVSIGSTLKHDLMGDVLLFKSDVCGNKEWCKIFNIPNQPDVGERVLQLANGDFIVLVYESGTTAVHKQVWLFCFDLNGNVLWQKVYCQNDPKMSFNIPNDMILLTDSSFLISGLSSYEDTLVPNLYWPEPLLVKINQNGDEVWARPWTCNTNAFIGWAIKSIEDQNGFIYNVGPRFKIPPNNIIGPTVTKSSINGTPLYHFEILNHPTTDGVASTINQISTDELIISYRYTDLTNIDHVMVIKADTFGNIIHEKELNLNGEALYSSIITSDNKLLMTGSFYTASNWQMYLHKLTFDLEYDSLDTQVYNYDSLCPNPTYADTIDLDCDVIINVEEPLSSPEKGKLRIFPNPAKDYVTVCLPDYYSSWSQVAGMSVQTTWYRYPEELWLEVVDMMGRLVYQHQVPDPHTETVLNITGLPGGMLLVRLMSHHRMLTSGKFIKE